MKTVEEVRRERLQMLRDEFGSLAALNAKLDLTARDSTLSQYLNQSKGSRGDKVKVMGSAMARRLEAACGKEVGWMDTDPVLAGAVVEYQALREKIRSEILAETQEGQEEQALVDAVHKGSAYRRPSPVRKRGT